MCHAVDSARHTVTSPSSIREVSEVVPCPLKSRRCARLQMRQTHLHDLIILSGHIFIFRPINWGLLQRRLVRRRSPSDGSGKVMEATSFVARMLHPCKRVHRREDGRSHKHRSSSHPRPDGVSRSPSESLRVGGCTQRGGVAPVATAYRQPVSRLALYTKWPLPPPFP